MATCVQCYRCGRKVSGPDIIMRDVQTHGWWRLTTVCPLCDARYSAEQAQPDPQEKMAAIGCACLFLLGTIAMGLLASIH